MSIPLSEEVTSEIMEEDGETNHGFLYHQLEHLLVTASSSLHRFSKKQLGKSNSLLTGTHQFSEQFRLSLFQRPGFQSKS